MGIADASFGHIGSHQGEDTELGAEHLARPAPGALDEELQVVVVAHELRDVLGHDCFVEFSVLLLVPLDEEGPRPPQQDVHHGHIQEVLGSSNMGALHPVTEEDVAHDQEVDVAAMRGNYNQRPLVRLIVALKTSDGSLVHHYSLVDGAEDLVEEPGEDSD